PGGGFYGPYDAQELLGRFAGETGVGVIASEELVYVVDADRYIEKSKVPPNAATRAISGTEVRRDYLAKGAPLPAWFTRPEVAAILAQAHPPRARRGFCIWLTGLPSSGKSSTADALVALLLERGRETTLLDGDVVRTHLSKGLGFSREDRDTNILRIGFVAAEIVRHGGAVVCAAVSPYRSTRDAVRAMFAPDHFIEVFVDTPLEVCEARDPKGMYAQARRGAIKDFTGVSDPYEPPPSPELTIDSVQSSPEANASRIIGELAARGFVEPAYNSHRGSVQPSSP
ncbi:MAG TPA: adenylyl-sulfate kinase, partial [Thermoanaerobaculia bacterium]|nr:adenylyl-sulfate kinase [Thermoanaerobaculia bacterium]